MKTIIAALDFSAISDAVLGETITLARALPARVVAVSIVQPPVITSEYAPYIDNLIEITEAGEKAASERLARIDRRLEDEGVGHETVRLAGAPIDQIVEQAIDRKADYIVMGSHGHTAFYDFLVGSTTHGVLLRAPCPVLIVSPKSGRPDGRRRRARTAGSPAA